MQKSNPDDKMLTPAAFLIAYSSGCLLALFRHPIFGLVTYIAVFYLHPPSRWWGSALPSLRWSLIAATVTLFAVLLNTTMRSSDRKIDRSLLLGLLVYLGWLLIQYFWALNPSMHLELIILTAKYVVLVLIIYKCIDTLRHLKMFLWAHAAGCFYLGILAFSQYTGGRFEGFGGPGIDEANAAGLLLVSGVLVTFVLFLSGNWIEKVASILVMPFTLNALVTTVSRSAFIALVLAGVIFNFFVSKSITKRVRTFSLLGLILLASITNPIYWERIRTILHAGEEIEGVDTGTGRLVLMNAQIRMFAEYPLGCGHRCTEVLSETYLAAQYLTEQGGRSSHNTFMSLMVEQGIPGMVLYVLLLVWLARRVYTMRDTMRNSEGLLSNTFSAVVASLGAMFVGDMFVDYLKFEARFWFLGVLLVVGYLHHQEKTPTTIATPTIKKVQKP